MKEYKEFLKSKETKILDYGIKIELSQINSTLFDYQKDIVRWAVRKGRCAVLLDTGLGKTRIQIEFARLLNENTLIIAPLSISRQTIKEAEKINIEIKYVRSKNEIKEKGIYITNYEMIDSFDFSIFGNVIIDESSILKGIGSVYRRKLIDKCKNIKYRMACTATPAPNDYIEIGSHAEFLGICTHAEMLARFFINANKEHTIKGIDGELSIKKGSNKNGIEWRIKHHAEESFYDWLSTWAVCFTNPENLGYHYDFRLPNLNVVKHIISFDKEIKLKGLQDRVQIKRETMFLKLERLKEILKTINNEQVIIWCYLNDENKLIKKEIKNIVDVSGEDSVEFKAKSFEDFQDNKYQILLTKSKIGGFGLNFQCAHNMIFFGLNDSWEQYYQAIRREWRYGQKEQVNVYIIITDAEIPVYNNIMRKEIQAERLKKGLIEHIKKYESGELKMIETEKEYKEDNRIVVEEDNYKLILGDSCEELQKVETDSVDLSVYSPPFVDLFTYTDSVRDLGNSISAEQFYEHYEFIIRELLRVTKPGRLSCVHTSDIPAMLQKDGYIGLKDFPGDVIRLHEKNGWIFHGRAFISKNPQAQAIRTKSKALLFVQLRKDSSDSRPALVDQILFFKKPGEGVPVHPVENGEIDNETWINWANGLWIGISESDTLRYSNAREDKDEKHICPLQLGTIERCIKMYSNPGELVLTPFLGIGSEIYTAIKLNRKGYGIELKESYFKAAVNNCKVARSMKVVGNKKIVEGKNVEELFF